MPRELEIKHLSPAGKFQLSPTFPGTDHIEVLCLIRWSWGWRFPCISCIHSPLHTAIKVRDNWWCMGPILWGPFPRIPLRKGSSLLASTVVSRSKPWDPNPSISWKLVAVLEHSFVIHHRKKIPYAAALNDTPKRGWPIQISNTFNYLRGCYSSHNHRSGIGPLQD